MEMVKEMQNDTQSITQKEPKVRKRAKRMDIKRYASRLVRVVNKFLHVSGRASMDTPGAWGDFAAYVPTIKWLAPYAAAGDTWYYRHYESKKYVAQARTAQKKPKAVKAAPQPQTRVEKVLAQASVAPEVTEPEMFRVQIALGIAQEAWQHKMPLDDKKMRQLALFIYGRGIAALIRDVVLTS